MTPSSFRSIALSFPDSEESPHFERAAFKFRGRRIFATLHTPTATATLKLSDVDQSVFCDLGKDAVYPVPNKWGTMGWTIFELKNAPAKMIEDALQTAYEHVSAGSKKKPGTTAVRKNQRKRLK